MKMKVGIRNNGTLLFLARQQGCERATRFRDTNCATRYIHAICEPPIHGNLIDQRILRKDLRRKRVTAKLDTCRALQTFFHGHCR